jgi:hypothetical protein
MQAVFSKFSPKIKDKENYHLAEDHFEKKLFLTNQAFSIIADTKLAKMLYNDASTDDKEKYNKISLAVLLFKSAQEKIKFACTNLRDEDGLFISKELETKSGENVYKKIESKNFILENAIFMKSIIEVARTLDDIKYPIFQNPKYLELLLDYIYGIFEMLVKHIEMLLTYSVSSISEIILSLIEFYNFTYNFEKEKQCFNMIVKCCAELESRTSPLDRLYETRNHSNIASLTSTCNAMKTLIKAYLCTGIEKFKQCAISLFDGMDFLWNNNYKLYIEHNERRLKLYTSDIGTIINSLYWLSTVDKVFEDKAIWRMQCIFQACFEKYKLQLSLYSPKFYEYLLKQKVNDAEAFNQYFPTFASYIKIRSKRNYIDLKDSEVNLGECLKCSLDLLDIVENMQ